MRKISGVPLFWIPYLMLKDRFHSIRFVGEAAAFILLATPNEFSFFGIPNKEESKVVYIRYSFAATFYPYFVLSK